MANKTNKIDKDTVKEITKAVTVSPYRDEKGVRILKYRRFKENEDYEPTDNEDMVALTNASILNLRQYRDDCVQGRPRKYETVDEFFTAVEAYFQYIQDANLDEIRLIPDIEGLCSYMGISRDSLFDWERTRDSRYIDAIKTVKNTIAFCKKQLALKGKIPPIVFATDFNNNHGYLQKQEISIPQVAPFGHDSDPSTIRKAIDSLPEPTD
jgi:hypothetical protein